VRLIGEYYFALIWLAALGIGEISAWFSNLARLKIPEWISAWAVTILVALFFLVPTLQALDFFHPRSNDEPRFVNQAIADYRLDELWDVLRVVPGRVWFTSYSLQLNQRGSEPFPTTLPALMPLFTNRPLMGGTYSHWSPIAARLWTGKIDPAVLFGLSQDEDDRALLGIPVEEISDAQLVAACERYNITTIVASINDYRTRTLLDASPLFQSYYNTGYFFVYRVKGYEDSWLDAQNATAELLAFRDDEITLRVRAARANASVTVKVYAYPLWRAHTDAGQSLTITRDDWGLMWIVLPPGEDYTLTLRYEDGVAEQIGFWFSVSSAILLVGNALFALRMRRTCGRTG